MDRLRQRGRCFLFISRLVVNGFATEGSEEKIPNVLPSVKSLDLSGPPSTEEIMAAGQLGGQLYPTAAVSPTSAL
ncbi:MAG: hypothetical protein AB1480_17915 [Nitrospirota bacterium]